LVNELPGRTPDHDPGHRDRQWNPPDIDLVAAVLHGLKLHDVVHTLPPTDDEMAELRRAHAERERTR
jgi:hypothetical protein